MLSPGPDVPFRAPNARLYNLLILHYVEGMTVQEAAHELGISRRQAHRDLRRGDENLATLLWTRRPSTTTSEPRATQLSSIKAEMARLEPRSGLADIRSLLQNAQKAVERLAGGHAVSFQVEMPSESVIIRADPVVVQQILVSVFSHAIQQSQSGTLTLALSVSEKGVTLILDYDRPDPKTDVAPVINQVVTQLVDELGWQVRQEDRSDGKRVIKLHMPMHGPRILVIDDNKGLVELLDRYLTVQACRVTAAVSGQEGLRLAQELTPNAIVLDIMMPEMDGWELLQRLRTQPQTADIPVIICSVFNDPELAYSLGATLFLPKPVSRADVLEALRQLDVI
jgi:CheY-like chemotaxis protein